MNGRVRPIFRLREVHGRISFEHGIDKLRRVWRDQEEIQRSVRVEGETFSATVLANRGKTYAPAKAYLCGIKKSADESAHSKDLQLSKPARLSARNFYGLPHWVSENRFRGDPRNLGCLRMGFP